MDVRFECGCRVRGHPEKGTELVFCPLHGAAREMLWLVRQVAHEYQDSADWKDAYGRLHPAAVSLVAAAEKTVPGGA